MLGRNTRECLENNANMTVFPAESNNSMRLLADTNIFIFLEENEVLSKSVADLARLTHSNGHKLMVHPASLEDIRRDSDSERQKINESKIRKYPFLESPPTLSTEEEIKLRLSANTPNDQVDNQILHAVAQNAVDILITEDRRIHTKARALGVSGRVHYLQQAVEFLHRMHEGLGHLAAVSYSNDAAP